MDSVFADWMHLQSDGLGRYDGPGITVLGLDPNRPWINASGVVPGAQLAALEATLERERDNANFLLLVVHYPVLGPGGGVYDNWHHGLLNVEELIAVFQRSARVPDLIVHGHKHHGYTATLTLDDGRTIPTYNCGSSGYARTADGKRAAATNIYTVDGTKITDVERYIYDGQTFVTEPGGLYQSGF